MSKCVKWTGISVRTNSFGTFRPNEAVEVPDHIAELLLTVPRFQLVSADKMIASNMSEESLRTALNVARQELDFALEANEALELALTAAQQELEEYREVVGGLDSAREQNYTSEEEVEEVEEVEETAPEDAVNAVENTEVD